jgi:hypothetical protein
MTKPTRQPKPQPSPPVFRQLRLALGNVDDQIIPRKVRAKPKKATARRERSPGEG